MTTPNDERVQLPAALAEIAEDFTAASTRERLELLLEFSDELPGLPRAPRWARGPAGAGG